jgi:uncharacterized membrane protein SirB2
LDYLLLKSVHVGSAAISLTGFVVRGVWMLTDSPRLHARWVRIAPHVVDTVLLVSALWLTLIIQQYPFVHDWLTAKVLALLGYIVLGSIALKRGRTRTLRVAAWVAALLVFGYIVAVATSRSATLGLI